MTMSTSGTYTAYTGISSLLQPIGGASPAGDWLFYDAVYDRLRDARRQEDATLPQGVWQRDTKRANWNDVEQLASAALTTRTKDLQIAAWLLEAWVHTLGFAGARRGLRLILSLCDRYWDDLHPRPDGDDYSGRALIVSWLSERVALLLTDLPLAEPKGLDLRAWTWGERQDSLSRENDELRGIRHDGDSREVIPVAKMMNSVAATPIAFYTKCAEDIGDALDAANAIDRLFDERCPDDAPSLNKLTGTLSAISDWVDTVVADVMHEPLPEEPPPPTLGRLSSPGIELSPAPIDDDFGISSSEAIMEIQHPPVPVNGTGTVGDHARVRAEAYRKLTEAAQTLMRVEPHSPTPYLVLRAIAWGEMSLAELMRHFINSGYDLKSLYSMLGMEGKDDR